MVTTSFSIAVFAMKVSETFAVDPESPTLGGSLSRAWHSSWPSLFAMIARGLGMICAILLGGVGRVLAQDSQAISWTAPSAETVLVIGKAYPLVAEAGSGLPVSFMVTAGPASIQGDQITATNVGMITVVAQQVGDATHSPARMERRFNRPTRLLQKESAWPGEMRPLFISGAAVSGSRLSVLDSNGRLQIFDVNAPPQAKLLGTWKSPFAFADPWTTAPSMAASGDVVFVAHAEGITSLDVSNPSHVQVLGQYTAAYQGWGNLRISGGHLVASGYGSGLEVFDLVDPSKPSLKFRYPAGSCADLQGGSAYVFCDDGSLRVLDIRKPDALVEVGRLDGLDVHVATSVLVDGTRVHICGDTGYVLVDVQDPSKPSQMGHLPTTSGLWSMGRHGSRVVLADGLNIRVLDVSQPNGIRQIGYFPGSHATSEIAVRGGVAFAQPLVTVVS